MAAPPPPLSTYLLPALGGLRGPRVALDSPFGFDLNSDAETWRSLRSGLAEKGTAKGVESSEAAFEALLPPLLQSLAAHGPLGALLLGALPEQPERAERWARSLRELLAEGGLMAIALPTPRTGLSGIWARAMSLRSPASQKAREAERLCEPLLAARLHRIRLHRSEAGTLAWGWSFGGVGPDSNFRA